MPIKTGVPMPEDRPKSIWDPDFVPTGQEEHAATYAMGYNEALPPNIENLPEDVQERLKARYRFLGIKLRPDIKETIPLTRSTMDLP